jgi:poly(3-hydroxybutyrate) depolymerase
MEADGDPAVPLTMSLAGGPIDTRRSPTIVNQLAERRGTDWFRRNVITPVPWPNQGFATGKNGTDGRAPTTGTDCSRI